MIDGVSEEVGNPKFQSKNNLDTKKEWPCRDVQTKSVFNYQFVFDKWNRNKSDG